jgi:protein CpxP
MSNHIKPIAFAIAAGAIVGSLMLGAPAQAATTGDSVTAQATAKPHGAHDMSRPDRVEGRITAMHQSLGITPAQEKQWTAVAQAMRDSAAAIETIADNRHAKIKTMTAVDDLRSYETLSQAHADGMKSVVAAFAPLYDAMSDSQKKTADGLFRHQERHRIAPKKA